MADQTFNGGYSLNGGLASAVCNLLVGVGVSSGSVLDFSPSAATLTIVTGETAPSPGTYGQGFWLSKKDSFHMYGYTVAGVPTFNANAGTSCALFMAVNEIALAANTNAQLVVASAASAGSFPGIQFASTVGSGLQPLLNVGGTNKLSSGDTLTTGTPHSLCIVSTNTGNFTFYVDGSQVAQVANTGSGSSAQTIGRLGSVDGQGSMTLQLAYLAYFSAASGPGDVLSAANVLALHNSLTGSGAFALVTGGSGGGGGGPILLLDSNTDGGMTPSMEGGMTCRPRTSPRIFLPPRNVLTPAHL